MFGEIEKFKINNLIKRAKKLKKTIRSEEQDYTSEEACDLIDLLFSEEKI